MFIRLDHGVDGEQYEEVIALYTGTSSQRHLIMWRDAAAVFLQPLIGPVAKALESNRCMWRPWLVVLCAAKRRSSVMEPCCDRKLRLTCSQYRTRRPWLQSRRSNDPGGYTNCSGCRHRACRLVAVPVGRF